MERENLLELLLIYSSENKAQKILDLLSEVTEIAEKKLSNNTNIFDDFQNENVTKTRCNNRGSSHKLASDFLNTDLKLGNWDPLLLWYLPRSCCIKELEIMVRGEGLSKISSIGCGSGLLEWIIASLTGLEVTGYEINKGWWSSPYAPPKFMPLVYIDEEHVDKTPSMPADRALLFCYFNDIEAFRNYINNYMGHCIIIIGSVDGRRMTSPNPLELKDSPEWELIRTHYRKDNDVVCCYRRTSPSQVN